MRDILRHLAGLGGRPDAPAGAHRRDERTAALARLAALVALGAGTESFRHGVEQALAAGATVDDVVDTLVVVAPGVGLARVVAVVPRLAKAAGYDVDAALEAWDGPPPPGDAARAHRTPPDLAGRACPGGAP